MDIFVIHYVNVVMVIVAVCEGFRHELEFVIVALERFEFAFPLGPLFLSSYPNEKSLVSIDGCALPIA